LWRKHGKKIIMVLDAALIVTAILIIFALGEIGAAR
jgi:hypothetical protein